jgi:hypothetical protein
MSFAIRMPQLSNKILLAALIASLCFAFYRGFHAAGLWTVNYYQAGIFDGFYRRALLGTLLTPFGCLRFDYFFVEAVQFLVLFAVLGLFVYVAIRSREQLALTVFFLSVAGGYFFHEVGYPEQFLWLVAAATIYALKHNRDYLAGALLFLAMLVHEMALLMVLPIVFLYWMLEGKESTASGLKIFLPPLIAFAAITLWFQLAPESILLHYFESAQNCGYPVLRKDYFSIYQSQFSGESARRFMYAPEQLMGAVLPVALLAVLFAYVAGRKLGLSIARGLVILACCVSPLFLGLVGSDSERWIFITYTQIMLAGILVSARVRAAHTNGGLLSGSPLFMAALVLLAAVLQLKYFIGEPRPLTLTHLSLFPGYVFNQIANPFYP